MTAGHAATARGDLVVCEVEELPPGSRMLVPHGKYGISLFNVDGRYRAVANVCPHRGAPLCMGDISGTVTAGEQPYEMVWEREGEFLKCPWHAWEFDLEAGRALAHPRVRIRTYPVKVRDGQIVIEGV